MNSLREVKTQMHFASDNNSGALPEIMQAMNDCNRGHVPSYGEDEFTKLANAEMQKAFGKCDIYYMFNGTAANVVALKSLLQPYEAVICSDVSHLQNDECGAPEANIGCKLLLCETTDGKLSPQSIEEKLLRLGDTHHVQAKVISITQPTEYGTTYTLEELQKLRDFAKAKNLYLHMDGSRLPNATIHLNCDLKEVVAGFDIISLGGTKNGLAGAEAILSFLPEKKDHLRYLRKQSMQLAGKMRFVSSQFYAWLVNDLWQDTARHVCGLAQELAAKLADLPEVEITQKVQSNAVFAKMPREVIKEVRKKYFFYVWNEKTWEVRLMISFDTKAEDVDGFVQAVKQSLSKHVPTHR
tara:strand:- start:201 stop:1262 length:1062 start_codon:yes stop_codon:yes gene_type:complete